MKVRVDCISDEEGRWYARMLRDGVEIWWGDGMSQGEALKDVMKIDRTQYKAGHDGNLAF